MLRFYEILPGLLTWLTLAGLVFLSWQLPIWVVIFVVSYEFYWLLKIFYLFMHLHHSLRRLKANLKIDWFKKLTTDPATCHRWSTITHLIILPMFREPQTVVEASLTSLTKINYPKEKLIVVLATEARGGLIDQKIAKEAEKKFSRYFGHFLITVHPADLPGELAGKGSNETWAAKQVQKTFIDPLGLDYKNILVSAFDIDTRPEPDYFSVLTYQFLTHPKAQHSSYQPIPIFMNNFREASPFARLIGFSATFWQLMQQARPKRLVTFSSHSIPFQALAEADFWPVDIVSEDSRIFFKLINHYNGDWQVTPLFYPVYMDAVTGRNLWESIKNIYKQQRRWGWGVENVVYIFTHILKNKFFPKSKKLFWLFTMLEGAYSWATSSFIIFFFGWLPHLLGGLDFQKTTAAYNLSQITSWIMNFSTIGIITLAFLSLNLLPAPVNWFWKKNRLFLFGQWFLMPLTFLFLSSLPALEAQTRMMIGGRWRLGFWRTPKRTI